MKKRRPEPPCEEVARAAQDRELTGQVADWFAREGRDLPWRKVGPAGRRDAWRSLVSEIMLQQTQVSRVLERYDAFLAAFPTPQAMSHAGEDAVLSRWAGMGYYRRARLLFAAAREISDRFGGTVPDAASDLRSLPGVGRYTAGAVASIVHGRVEPIVDGNVSRVLLRIHGVEQTAAESADWCWDRAGELAQAAGPRVAAFNEGLMELGAVVCTPKAPRCGSCPIAASCEARRTGRQDRIPKPKVAAAKSAVLCQSFLVRDEGRVLVERRPDRGMWAGLWQTPTLETPHAETPVLVREAAAAIGFKGIRFAETPVLEFDHATTHRAVRFVVYEGVPGPKAKVGDARRWVTVPEALGLGVSNAQKRILTFEPMLFGSGSKPRR